MPATLSIICRPEDNLIVQFHFPLQLRGWHEFADEVAIILLGVLIALGLGQIAQAWYQISPIITDR